jgi:protein-disulfide isomerase
MDTLQKLAVPLSIIIAGGIIAVAVFISNAQRAPVAADPSEPTVEAEIRGVQDDDHILGSKDAKLILVEFSDTECPFCKQFHDTLQRIVKEYGSSGDVAWVYRHFPLEQLHPKAPKEAEALECAAELGGNEKFWEFTNAVYASTKANNSLDIGVYNTPAEVPLKPDGTPYYTQSAPKSESDAGQLTTLAVQVGLDAKAFEECLASGRHTAGVTEDLEEVAAAGGRGTPHSILITPDRQIPIEGAQPYANIKALIDAELAK